MSFQYSSCAREAPEPGLVAGVAGPHHEVAVAVPRPPEILADRRVDPARTHPMRVDGQQPVAPERDRLAVLAGQPGADRLGPGPAVGRAPRDVDVDVAAVGRDVRPEHVGDPPVARVRRETLVPVVDGVVRVGGDEDVLGPGRAIVVRQAQPGARDARRGVLVLLPVLERLGERPVGQAQDGAGHRRARVRPQVDPAAVRPRASAVGRADQVAAHAEEALGHRVDPRVARVRAIGPQDRGDELARHQLRRDTSRAPRPASRPRPVPAARGTGAPSRRRRRSRRTPRRGRRRPRDPCPAGRSQARCRPPARPPPWTRPSAR